MIYTLKPYQLNAIEDLKQHFNLYINKSCKTIVFKAPTGSGKTLMISSFIEQIVEENPNLNICFIWASIGKGELQKQSYESVKNFLSGHPKCTLLEEDFFGYRDYIKNQEIVFINWEKLISKDKESDKWINNLMKDQEGNNFLDIIDNTKKNGTKIMLIIDESHIGSSSSSRISEFKETVIIPDITLEMSATTHSQPNVVISSEEVINEGMIKENVIVNEGITKESINGSDLDTELLILTEADKKRKELIEQYKLVNSNVNPLVLVQIPNTEEGEAKKIVIKDFLKNLSITEENGKLKLWCDNKSDFDKKAIKDLDDETSYLIFKTAVATGWDCPRAHILVKFREGKSETFEIQTIGRILRTAEAKSYNNQILDNAYIYTNIKEFETKHNSYNPNKIKTEFSYFNKSLGYKNKQEVWEITQLKSFYRSRKGDYNSADSRFTSFFEKEFMDFFNFKDDDKNLEAKTNEKKLISKGFDTSNKAKDEILEEKYLKSETIDRSQNISGDLATVKMSENDIEAMYYKYIRESLNGLAYVRSKSPINSAIWSCFSNFYDAYERHTKIKNFKKLCVLNYSIFTEILSKATSKFRNLLIGESGKKGVHYDFKIEEKRAYSSETHKSIIAPKSLYQPLYVLYDRETGKMNNLEKEFIDFLCNSEEVLWFWENGPELMQVNFGISYNNGLNTFQPDFIVKYTDGSIGIYDTKPIGDRVEDTKIKAEALADYIENININRKNAPRVHGGIVVKHGSNFYINNSKKYVDFKEDISSWRNFKEIFVDIRKQKDTRNKIKNNN